VVNSTTQFRFFTVSCQARHDRLRTQKHRRHLYDDEMTPVEKCLEKEMAFRNERLRSQRKTSG
jgi:hypothetical protein